MIKPFFVCHCSIVCRKNPMPVDQELTSPIALYILKANSQSSCEPLCFLHIAHLLCIIAIVCFSYHDVWTLHILPSFKSSIIVHWVLYLFSTCCVNLYLELFILVCIPLVACASCRAIGTCICLAFIPALAKVNFGEFFL